MKMPYSIPEWIKFCSKLEDYGIDVSFTTNAINGEHTADAFVGNRNIRFKLAKFTHNLVVSFKSDEEIVRKIVEVFEEVFEAKYVIKYHANGNKFCYNYEWYWDSPSTVVEQQISQMCSKEGYSIMELKGFTNVSRREPLI